MEPVSPQNTFTPSFIEGFFLGRLYVFRTENQTQKKELNYNSFHSTKLSLQH